LRQSTLSPDRCSAPSELGQGAAEFAGGGHLDPVEVEPIGHLGEFGCQRLGEILGAWFGGDGGDQEGGVLAVGFEVDAGDQSIAEEERQYVVPVDALCGGGVDADPVEEVEESFGAVAVPDQGVEGREQGAGVDRVVLGAGGEVALLRDAFDLDRDELAGVDEAVAEGNGK
jgi:hypothetical protein